MRWLFAMLIALFCWAGSVSGQQLYAEQTAAVPTVLTAQVSNGELVISSYDHAYRSPSALQRKPPGKLLLLLPRVHSCPGSLLAPSLLVPAYTLATDLGYPLRPQWLPATPAPNRLQQVNWTLHSPQQQSRLGGWKESNILYRGSLTYYS
ncbi:hypothetical protein ACQ86O_08680 [Serratia sp. L9]|uniref:hypothetical protein n=1 Tax=Serratia sp. L9 TaxID=3423946 RepID=UPI003D679A98